MPSNESHAYFCRLFFGRSYLRLNRAIDRPKKYLGKQFRIKSHTQAGVITIAKRLYPQNSHAVDVALYHLQLDQMCKQDYKLKKLVESMGKRPYCRTKKTKAKRQDKLSSLLEWIRPILAFTTFLIRIGEETHSNISDEIQ